MSEVTRQNGEYWEALAAHRRGESVDVLRGGGEVVSRDELAAMGDLVGKRVLQVAASIGDESLSLALLGAEPTAVDIAPTHVNTGRAKAAELGVEVDYRVGDMMALSDDLRDFDVIYISWGGLCWVPEIVSWVADMAERLTPGGRLVIAEHHPLWDVLSVTGPDRLGVTASYFDQQWRGARDLDKEPQIVEELGLETTSHTSFVWNLGQVVTAMLRAELSIATLWEYGSDEMYSGLDAGRHLPATYIIAGERPLAQ